ncbi:MAG: HlyD family type I secretion periplasmic adaptor subunit [Bacteroidetes bacterium]|nr:HlyD family type I secretion periplasmic adaptor subunit [Bacteroidota bacterium]
MAFLIGFLAVTLLILLLGVWGTRAKISGAVVASGLIQVENNRQVVQHPDGGLVGNIHARNGDFVDAGQVLISLKSDDVVSELAILNTPLLEATARRMRLIAERDGNTNIAIPHSNKSVNDESITGQVNLFHARRVSFEKELEQINEQIIQTQEQIRGVDAQIEAVEIQLDLLAQDISSNTELEQKGLLVRSTLLNQLRAEANLKGEMGSLISLRGQHRSAIASHELSKIRLDNTKREKAIVELRDVEVRRWELNEKINILRRKLERMEITAPTSGIVFGSEVFTLNAVIPPANPVMYIIPQDQALIVSAKIAAKDIDQVSAGQTAALRFSALDQKFTPEITGTVITVSADAVLDEKTGISYYEAEVAPIKEELAELGDQALIPGMPVETYIRTAERSPLNYLTKPLTDYFYRAFREN